MRRTESGARGASNRAHRLLSPEPLVGHSYIHIHTQPCLLILGSPHRELNKLKAVGIGAGEEREILVSKKGKKQEREGDIKSKKTKGWEVDC
jgi:hypothetical protein